MDADLPIDLPGRAALLAREKAYSHDLQSSGKCLHIWRIVGAYSNLTVFDVTDNEELHHFSWSLPLFPYMTITPLAEHPSSI